MPKDAPDRPAPESPLEKLVEAYLRGEAGSEEALVEHLQTEIVRATRRFLPRHDLEFDDVVSHTLLASLQHIKHKGEYETTLRPFVITVARNRCRNIVNLRHRYPSRDIADFAKTLRDPEWSPIDDLEKKERREALQRALDQMDDLCRTILRAFFIERRPIKDILALTPYSTVQGVYYRRSKCLGKARDEVLKLLDRRRRKD